MGLNTVRLTYWLGALVDALAGIQLLMPATVTILGFRGLRLPGAAGYAAFIAAALMFGFTALLIWAHLRTVDRRYVLLVTLCVVLALAAVNIGFGAAGILPWSQLVPPLCIQTVLAVLFGVSLRIAVREAARRAQGAGSA